MDFSAKTWAAVGLTIKGAKLRYGNETLREAKAMDWPAALSKFYAAQGNCGI